MAGVIQSALYVSSSEYFYCVCAYVCGKAFANILSNKSIFPKISLEKIDGNATSFSSLDYSFYFKPLLT